MVDLTKIIDEEGDNLVEEQVEIFFNRRENFYIRLGMQALTGFMIPFLYYLVGQMFWGEPKPVAAVIGLIFIACFCYLNAVLAVSNSKAWILALVSVALGYLVTKVNFGIAYLNIPQFILFSIVVALIIIIAYKGYSHYGWVGILITLAIIFYLIYKHTLANSFSNEESMISFNSLFSALIWVSLYVGMYLVQNIKKAFRNTGLIITLIILMVAFSYPLTQLKQANAKVFDQVESIEKLEIAESGKNTIIEMSAAEKKALLAELKGLQPTTNSKVYNKEGDFNLVLTMKIKEKYRLEWDQPQVKISVYNDENVIFLQKDLLVYETMKDFHGQYKVAGPIKNRVYQWREIYMNGPGKAVAGKPKGCYFRPVWLNNNELAYFYWPGGTSDDEVMIYNYEQNKSSSQLIPPGLGWDNKGRALPGDRFIVINNKKIYLYNLGDKKKKIFDAEFWGEDEKYGWNKDMVAFLSGKEINEFRIDYYLNYANFEGRYAKALLPGDIENVNAIYVSPFNNVIIVDFFGKYQMLSIDYATGQGHWQALKDLPKVITMSFIDKDTIYALISNENGAGSRYQLAEFSLASQKLKVLADIDTDYMTTVAAISPEGNILYNAKYLMYWDKQKGKSVKVDEQFAKEITWSADGKKVAYMFGYKEPGEKIKIYDTQTGQTRYVK